VSPVAASIASEGEQLTVSTVPNSKGWILPADGSRATSELESSDSIFSLANWKRTYLHARTVASNSADAEDIAQETFLRLHRALDSGHKIDSLTGWMKAVVRRVAVDHFRKTRPDLHVALDDGDYTGGNHRVSLADIPDLTISTEDQLAADSVLRESLRILSELPERDRECIMMYARGCTFVHIASVLNIPYDVAIRTTKKALLKTRRRVNQQRQLKCSNDI
jgi:RNA polymerase sigma factor (sigma-70 family)